MAAPKVSYELADSFLADFESSDDDINIDENNEEEKEESLNDLTIENTTKLMHDQRIINHIANIEIYLQKVNISKMEEYPFIVKCNELSIEIENDMIRINRVLRDLYSIRFPELEQIITNPLDYAKIVQRIGDEKDISKINFEGIVASHTLMVLKIATTSTKGVPLTSQQYLSVNTLISAVVYLEEAQKKIYSYIASRMTVFAPNITCLLGPDIAARMVSAAGGLEALSRMPAGNIQVLGGRKGPRLRMGIIGLSEIVNNTPKEYRNKAARHIASKLALLARMDAYSNNLDNSAGRSMKDEVLKKIDKLSEPPPVKGVKALPIPQESRKKRRGGGIFII